MLTARYPLPNLGLRRAVKDLAEHHSMAESSVENESVLIEEVEQTGTSLEEMQAQNATLLVQLQEKEETMFEMMTAKSRADAACKSALDKTRLGAENVKLLQEENGKKTALLAKYSEDSRMHQDQTWQMDRAIRDHRAQLEQQRKLLDEKDKQLAEARQEVEAVKQRSSRFGTELDAKVRRASSAENDLKRMKESQDKLKRELSRAMQGGVIARAGSGGSDCRPC